MEDARGRLRELPSVDEVLARPAVRALEVRMGRAAVKAAVRQAVAAARERILSGAAKGPGELVPDQEVLSRAEREAAPRLRRVINATGVVLHTNLGRAPLHPEVVARVAEVASGYSNLEVDLVTGRRGHRSAVVEPLLCELFAAEAAHAVNNCAGATLLALAALGSGGAAVVSRGELVEIGGGFRVPEILAQSGCRLVEGGTTNRTRLSDYSSAPDGHPPGAARPGRGLPQASLGARAARRSHAARRAGGDAPAVPVGTRGRAAGERGARGPRRSALPARDPPGAGALGARDRLQRGGER